MDEKEQTPAAEAPAEKTIADAASYSEHRAMRAAARQPKEEPKPEPKPAELAKEPQKEEPKEAPKEEKKEAAPKDEEGETEEEAAAPVDGQEPPKKPSKKSADGRISELTRKFRDEERRRLALEKEVADLRAAKPASPAPAAAPKAEDAPQASDDGPQIGDYQDYEKWIKAVARWEAAQEARAQRTAWEKEWEEKQQNKENEQKQATIQRTMDEKVSAARAKYEDFDLVTDGDPQAGTGLILRDETWVALIHQEDGMDLLYLLGKDPEAVERVKRMPAAAQLLEIGKIAARAAKESNGNGHKPPAAAADPKPDPPKAPAPSPAPISRLPKPPTPVGGAEEPAPKSVSEAKDYQEHKRLRMAQAASRR